MPFAAKWMDLEIIIQTEVRQKRQTPYDITYIWNLKYDTNELIYKTNRVTDRKETYGYQMGGMKEG